jgi:hypothetical protein
MSRVDDGARSLDGLTDRGVTSHGVTRASHLRVGQKLKSDFGGWRTLKTVEINDGRVTAKSGRITWFLTESSLVEVRDILHPYTDTESETA